MLVLTRKSDETIHIGNQIEVRVLAIKGNRVTIGIEAPQNIRITRGELPQWNDSDMDSDSNIDAEFESDPSALPALIGAPLVAACAIA